MREIKYRAWKHVNTPEMFNEVQGINFVGGIVHLGYRLSSDTVRIDKELLDNLILMQFTGLIDKNGKEIYEGDIVLADSEYGEKVRDIVCWSYGSFYVANHTFKKLNNIEVIGNIYQHKHLLKENEE